MQHNYEEAVDVLKKAQDQFIEIGDRLGVAQCSQSLGNILHMQHNYKEAVEVLKKAQDQFVEIGDQLGVAQCSQSLGNILCAAQLQGGCGCSEEGSRPIFQNQQLAWCS
jgi:hypothetical protein